MKKLVLTLLIITLLAVLFPGFAALAQPARIPHEDPATAENSLGVVPLLLFYSSVFDLAEQLGCGEYSHSLQTLRHLLEQGEPEVGLVWMLTRHYFILTKICRLAEKRISDQEIARVVQMRPSLIPSYVRQARRLSSSRLEKVFSLLVQADTGLKSGQQNPRLIMELLVFALCHLDAE